MKKIISLVLVLTMAVGAAAFLSGCGSSDSSESKDKKTTVTVLVADTFGDKSFYDSGKEGLDKAAKDYDINAKTIECQGENFEQRLRDAAEQSDLVIPIGFQFDMVGKVAKDYPNVKFAWIDNVTEDLGDNIMNVVYAQNEGSYLVGYIAAKMSKTGVVGVVGGADNPTINDFVKGFEEGAQKANPNIKVEKRYLGDFNDTAKGKEAATNEHNAGADVIYQVAGNAGQGVFEAAKEGGYYAIGVDSDQKYLAPDTIICSMVKKVGDSIYKIIGDYAKDGKWEGNRTWTADMSEGFLEVSYGGKEDPQQVSEDIKKDVEQIQKDIVDGKIKVGTTR